MAIQELNQVEINEVAGGLTINLGTAPISIDLNALIDNLQGTLNGVVDGVQSFIGSLLAKLPTIPVISIPALGLIINLSITQ
jgi:hypothetical protein